MATETTFFSYARADSAFALKLAKDLRDSGAEIWLDQLDIKPGSHWDASIELALDAAACMIVILSPASVASNNVMDEVSFALENGKRVIPVLLHECKLPFRLRRLQYVNFTGAYETGFNQLVQSLNLSVSENKRNNIKEPGPGISQTPARDKSNAEKKQSEEQENKLWEEASRLNTVSSYKKYIQETSSGIHKEKALQLIEELGLRQENEENKRVKELNKEDERKEVERKQEKAGKEKKAEILFWENIKTSSAIEFFEKYLKLYPSGIYINEANKQIKILQAEKENKIKNGDDYGSEVNSQQVSNPSQNYKDEQRATPSENRKYLKIGLAIAGIIVLVVIIVKINSGHSNSSDPSYTSVPIDSVSHKTEDELTKSQEDSGQIPESPKKPVSEEQPKDLNDDPEDKEEVLTKVEIDAQFPGGQAAWTKYILGEIEKNQDEFTESDYGTCIVKFVVNKSGRVSNVEAVTMKGTKLAEVATNTIRKGPKWTPARQNGRYVNAYRLQPVTVANPNSK